MERQKIHGKIYDAIPDYALVKVYKYGNTIEITDAPSTGSQIKILSGKKYQNRKNGKILQMKRSSVVRSENTKSIRATMARLRRLIGANFSGGKSELWITLTYADWMRDSRIVYRDFKVFMQKIRKQYSQMQLEYISVLEPQASGSWHLHVLLKSRSKSSLYIPNNVMQKLWNHGFTKTKRLKQSDNVASYVMAYLNDLPVGKGKRKQIIKGLRLYYYPSNTNIYRRSRGIKDPLMYRDFKGNVVKNISEKLSSRYKKTYHRQDQDIFITTEFYDSKGEKY